MFKGNIMETLPNGGMVSVVPKRVYTHIEFASISDYVDWLNENGIEPEAIVSCVIENHVYKVVYYYYKSPFADKYANKVMDSIREMKEKEEEYKEEGASK